MVSGLLSNRWTLIAHHTVPVLERTSRERVCSGHVRVPSGFSPTRDQVIASTACAPVRLREARRVLHLWRRCPDSATRGAAGDAFAGSMGRLLARSCFFGV